MKKIGLWKKLASWLLVFLLVLQIPTDVFAEEWISGTDISVDSDFAEEDAGYVEEEENTDFIDDEKIEETVKTAGLENDIFFVGKQKNVNAFLSAMDLFLFPSLFEGVPFALIEAQASGLPCVASDTISEETLVFPEKVKYLSLKEENRVWAGEICKMGELPREKAGQLKEKLANKHFDIALEAVQLKKLYQE